MTTITTINGGDDVKDSRVVINTNFANLNNDKAEKTELESIERAAFNALSTGLESGGLPTPNGGDNTKMDISDGSGRVVDNTTDPDNPTVTDVVWTGLTALTVTNIGTTDTTYLAINSAGAVVQQTTNFTNAQSRSLIILGGVFHPNLTNVISGFETPTPGIDTMCNVRDLALAIGALKLEGGVYSANGANLNIDRTAGLAFAFGENTSNNVSAPSDITIPQSTALSFLRSFNNGSGGSDVSAGFQTNVDPDNYDDGSGTLATLANNKWQIKRILFFPSSQVSILNYGQVVYNSLDEAISNLTTPVTTFPEQDEAILMGYLVVKKGAIALNGADADFRTASKFEAPGGSASTNTATMQGTYENSSTPHITTTALNGSPTTRGGTGTNTDKLAVYQNNAGTETASIDGNGDAEFNDISKGGVNVSSDTEAVTFTNKRITTRVNTITSSATPTPAGDSTDEFIVTALAVNATFAAPTGTPTDGQVLLIRIKDNATDRTLAWNTIYRASSDLALPTTTIISKTLYLQFVYNSADAKFDLLGLLNNF